MPALTLLVPVRDPGSELDDLVRSIDAQSAPRATFDVVLVDGGSHRRDAGPAAASRRGPAERHVPVRLVRPGPGRPGPRGPRADDRRPRRGRPARGPPDHARRRPAGLRGGRRGRRRARPRVLGPRRRPPAADRRPARPRDPSPAGRAPRRPAERADEHGRPGRRPPRPRPGRHRPGASSPSGRSPRSGGPGRRAPRSSSPVRAWDGTELVVEAALDPADAGTEAWLVLAREDAAEEVVVPAAVVAGPGGTRGGHRGGRPRALRRAGRRPLAGPRADPRGGLGPDRRGGWGVPGRRGARGPAGRPRRDRRRAHARPRCHRLEPGGTRRGSRRLARGVGARGAAHPALPGRAGDRELPDPGRGAPRALPAAGGAGGHRGSGARRGLGERTGRPLPHLGPDRRRQAAAHRARPGHRRDGGDDAGEDAQGGRSRTGRRRPPRRSAGSAACDDASRARSSPWSSGWPASARCARPTGASSAAEPARTPRQAETNPRPSVRPTDSAICGRRSALL